MIQETSELPAGSMELDSFDLDRDNVDLDRESEDKSLELIYDEGLESSTKVQFLGHTVIIEPTDIRTSFKLKVQVFSTFLTLFATGVVDQSLGSVMHHILDYYQTDRIHLSYVFIFQALGYTLASFGNNTLSKKFGMKGVYPFALFLMGGNALALALKSDFRIIELFAILNGLGIGTVDCTMNLFVGALQHSNQLLGLMHASYGLGCFVSPSLATYLIHKGLQWNQFYIMIVVVIILNFTLALLYFKNETKWKYQYKLSIDQEESGIEQESSFLEILSNKYVLFFSACLFLYIGCELSIGLWLFNYMLQVKKSTENYASLITSAYWIFMTMGRLVLGFVTGKVFENKEVKALVTYCWLVTLGCVGFLFFNKSPALLGISISMVGFFVGPIFATTVVVAIKSLPKEISTSGVSIVCGLGATGASIFPSLCGVVAEKFNGGHGAGLVYFPLFILVTVLTTSCFWLGFYLKNRKALESYQRL